MDPPPPQPSTPSEPPPPQTTTPPPPPTTTTTTPEPPQPQSQPPPTTTTTITPPPPPQQPPPTTPSPNPKPPIPLQQQPPQPPRPPFPRGPPYTQPPPPFPHFSSITNPSSSPSPSQRGGGMAIGVPAPTPPPPHPNFPPPFTSQHFANTPPQVRQSITGMMGSLGAGSSLRPNTAAALSHPQRPVQTSLRPQTAANNMSQNFPEHGHVRLPSTASPAPTTSQSTQPWLNSGAQAKTSMPHSQFRPQMNPQSLQQRSHLPSQQQTTISTPTQPPQTISSLQPQSSSLSQQTQEQYSLPPSRVPQSSTPQQQQLARNRALGNQRPFSQTVAQPTSPAPPPPTFNRPPAVVEAPETCNRIISKRSIQEIVSQIDPSERLDPEVEDILVDIADEFLESVTTFACSLAKHRKSNTLESKDVLLHLERNWNMSLPGFSGDEIKCYKKPFGNDAHRERLAAIKRSVAAAETSNTKTAGGPAGGGGGGSGAKGHPAKAAPGLVIGSPNPKGS
ncbi:Histone-fold [Artemisia annua]|uniref:Histone-fold n=1 Tax=Artemisia annua TaxID=35608 RepID=A0A2U1LTR9_ARTAN|nr:Histone-fold [Artemisia annua]